jgi:hypothetical protein
MARLGYEHTNFPSVKKGKIILILTFFSSFKDNYEEYIAPPPVKRAREGGAAPQHATHWLENPAATSVQECKAVSPFTFHHALPSRAVPPTLGQEVQHASPGPSGTQLQPGYKNLSIFLPNL